MAEAKTKPSTESLESYLGRIVDPQRRADCAVVAELMARITGRPAVIWGTGIVGFGLYRYTYESGKTGDWPVAAFAARKNDLTIYISPSVESYPELLPSLGKYKHAKVCLYIKKLSDVDVPTLTELISRGVDAMKTTRVE